MTISIKKEGIKMWKQYVYCLKNFNQTKGRATRYEYWSFIIINGIISVILATIYHAIFKETSRVKNTAFYVYSLLTLIPVISAEIRRLHDTNRKDSWVILSFIPILSLIPMIFLLQKSAEEKK